MKKILMMAALAFIGFTAKAQDVNNNTDCEVEVRQFCLDANCNKTYPGGGTWTTIGANTHTTVGISSCSPGSIVGFEVQYASSTGCSNPAISVQDINFPALCPGIGHHVNMGACSCSGSPVGPDVHFTGAVLHIAP